MIKSPRSLKAFELTAIKPKDLDPVDILDLKKKLVQQFGKKFNTEPLLKQKLIGLNSKRKKDF